MHTRQAQGQGLFRPLKYSARSRSSRVKLVVAFVIVASIAGMVGASYAAALGYTIPPNVEGNAHPKLGETLECHNGVWKESSPEFSYQWVIEGRELGFKSLKQSLYAAKITLKAEYQNKEIWCDVKATEGSEVAVAESENSICFGSCVKEPPQEGPVNQKKPEVSGGNAGKAVVGETLTCSQGTWTGTAPIVYAYKWFHKDVKEAIGGATSNQYKVVAEDQSHELSCHVTASNKGGEQTVESTNSISVLGKAPQNTTPPEVLGNASVNETLTCNPGTWSGSTPITYEYRWLRNGSEIPMETGPTLTVQVNDEGQKLGCRVTAKNNIATNTASSAEVTVSKETLKVETSPTATPTTAKVNTQLECTHGTWNEPTSELTFKYEWLRDRETQVQLSTSGKYTVVSGDVKHTLYCRVFATNPAKETASAFSGPVSVPGEAPPVNKVRPEVQGTPALGHTLTCAHGTWSPEPTSYTYQWARESAPIGGATSSTYEVKAADQGHWVACRVTAFDAEGPSEQVESLLANVPGEAPSNVRAPEIQGGTPPRVGEALTCVRGEWKGAPTPTYSYAWFREGTEELATGPSYTIANADRGHSLSCAVTATNTEPPFHATATSASLKVPGYAPEPPLEGPQIEGTAAVEHVLSCKAGTWTGQPAPTFGYQWLVDGSPIEGATETTFRIAAAYSGYNISCRVTGTNSEGSVSAVSKSVHAPGSPPEIERQPFITGGPVVGGPLTCERGVWSQRPPHPTFTYQWYRGSIPIPGATEQVYIVEAADMGQALSCNVLGVSSEGSLEQESENSVLIPTGSASSPVVVPTGGGGSKTSVAPTAAEILASIKRQVNSALIEAHLKKIAKAGSFSFVFTAPGGGTFELKFFRAVRGAHGAKTKNVLLGVTKVSYTKVAKQTVKLRLNAAGRRLLKGKKHVKLSVKAIYTLRGHSPVTWSATVTLQS